MKCSLSKYKKLTCNLYITLKLIAKSEIEILKMDKNMKQKIEYIVLVNQRNEN